MTSWICAAWCVKPPKLAPTGPLGMFPWQLIGFTPKFGKLPDLGPPDILAQPKLGTHACEFCCINVCCWVSIAHQTMLVPVLAFRDISLLTSLHRIPWPLASRFVVLANPCTFCNTFACCCCGCCWGMLLVSDVCPSIPDPLPCWLGVLGTGGNPSLRLQPPFPVPGDNPSPRLQPPLPSPLSAIPGLGQPCTPWLTLPGSIPTTLLRAASRQLRYHAEGDLNLRNLLGSASRTSSLNH